MSVDRINTRDTDVESVEEPPSTDRTPPPDTPGQDEGASRADSRAGAAVANAAAGERQGDTAEERRDEPQDEDPPNEDPPDEDLPNETLLDKDPSNEDPLNEDPPRENLIDKDPPDEAPSMAVETTRPKPEPTADDEAYGARDQDTAAIDVAPATEPVPPEGGADEVTEQDSAAADPDDDAERAGENDDEPRSALVPVEDDVPAKAGPAKEPEDRGRATDTGEHTTARPPDTPAPRLEPLTDREYAEHTAHLASSLDAAAKRGESTEVRYTLNPERTIWSPDRAELHQQIVDDLYSAAADVPTGGQAIVAGGLGGAGKSTTLEGHAGIDRLDYLTINPDDIKESLAQRGMIPPVKGLDPMERSALVHEESSQIARLLAERAYADRKNVIWDVTMSSRSSTARRIQQLREAGYRNIQGVFVDIPVSTSMDRAQVRHRQGMEDHRNGKGLGGRYVPPDVIRANADVEWGSFNRRVFEDLKPRFDQWKLYDNSVDGRGPVLLESSDGAGRDDDE